MSYLERKDDHTIMRHYIEIQSMKPTAPFLLSLLPKIPAHPFIARNHQSTRRRDLATSRRDPREQSAPALVPNHMYRERDRRRAMHHRARSVG